MPKRNLWKSPSLSVQANKVTTLEDLSRRKVTRRQSEGH